MTKRPESPLTHFYQVPGDLRQYWEVHHPEQTLGVITGVFDLLHAWQEPILRRAASRCDGLVVGLCSDGLMEEHNLTAVGSLEERAEMLLGTQYTDFVTVCSSASSLMEGVRPDVLVENTGMPKVLREQLRHGFRGEVASVKTVLHEVEATRLLIQRIRRNDWSRYVHLGEHDKKVFASDKIFVEYFSAWDHQQTRVVTTNGGFDLLHLGHLRYLQRARQQGGRLAVLVNDDPSITSRKGTNRPLFYHPERMQTLAMLECVDWVVPFYGDNPLYLLDQIQPDLHIKGGSFEEQRIAQEKQLVESHGGELRTLELVGDFSTTRLLEKIRRF